MYVVRTFLRIYIQAMDRISRIHVLRLTDTFIISNCWETTHIRSSVLLNLREDIFQPKFGDFAVYSFYSLQQ